MSIFKYILIVLICYSCSSSPREEKGLLQEAAKIHNEMVDEMEKLEQALYQFQQVNKNAFVQDSISILLSVIGEWESELVEVPGNEHVHHHGEHHHHQATADLTSQELLDIQRELDRRRRLIQRRADALMN
jgi:hypothetical protein